MHVSTLKLHQLRYGELSPEVAGELRAHLDGCDTCRDRLHAQQATRAEFVTMPIPAAIQELEAKPSPWLWLRELLSGGWGSPGMVAVALLALLVVGRLVGFGEVEHEGVRYRGVAPEMEVWLGTEAGARVLGTSDALRSGDQVQLVFDPKGAGWVVLAGRDGTENLEVYDNSPVVTEGLQSAPFSLTLDDAAGPQAFFIVTSSLPLTEAEVAEAIAGAGEGTVQVRSMEFRKE